MPSDKPECLVIMPFGKDAASKAISQGVYRDRILPAFKKALGKNARYYRIDAEYIHNPIREAITERLKRAAVVVADISGDNPNVLFELGFRYAQGKPFVCISNRPDLAVFWTSTFQIIDYNSVGAIEEIGKGIKKAFADIQNRLESEDELDELTNKIRGKEKFDNPFQDQIAAWRLRQSIVQVTSIQKRDWEFEAKEPLAYLAFMFERIMELLEPGEEYLTVTNMNFWSDRAVGKSAFLKANIEAAKRGIIIKRVFLLDKREWEQEPRREELVRILREHKHAGDQVSGKGSKKMEVKCLLLDRREFKTYGHSGIARRKMGQSKKDCGCVVIVPGYSVNKKISKLKLIFSKGPSESDARTLEYVDEFEKALSAGQTLHSFLRRPGARSIRVRGEKKKL